MSFVFTNNMSLVSIVSSSASVGDVKSITLLVVVGTNLTFSDKLLRCEEI